MKCRKCQIFLVVGDNWSNGLSRQRDYLCRSCKSAITSQWQKDHPEQVRAQRSSYRKRRNMLACKKRAENPEPARDRQKRYALKHRDRVLDKQRRTNRKRTIEGKCAAATANYRLKLKRNGIAKSGEEQQAIKRLYAWSRWWQELSDNHISYHVDHIVPVARGGPHTLRNLRICLASINQSKGASL